MKRLILVNSLSFSLLSIKPSLDLKTPLMPFCSFIGVFSGGVHKESSLDVVSGLMGHMQWDCGTRTAASPQGFKKCL